MSFDYHIPTKICFGAGKLEQLAEEMLPGTKALIVISCGTAMRKHGYLKRVEDLLAQQHVETVVFDKIRPNPIKEHVMEGAALAKASGCDFVIGLGGGSSIDAAEGYIANVATPMSDLYALESIRLIAEFLPRAVADGGDLEAREKVALANTLAGTVESTSCCISEHSLEHAMSGRHPELPHGAGLIMLSKAYFSHFAALIPERFEQMARAMGGTSFVEALLALQKACGVHELKMSDYGIRDDELKAIAENARDTMGFLFDLDPVTLSEAATESILRSAFR